MRIFLISVKPTFSQRILDGTKKFELRRTTIRAERGDLAILYASAPTKAIVGAFVIGGVTTDNVEQLWLDHERHLGVSRGEFARYFEGREKGCAIEVQRVISLPPIHLDELRKRVIGFRPPQSYQRWSGELVGLIGKTVRSLLR